MPFSTSAFPPATLAGQDFTPYLAASTRGITQLQGRLASSGDEVVAVGAETGQLVPRAQFFTSRNDGRSWTLDTVTAADGGAPAPGYTPRFVAGGQGKWVAIGPYSLWTSANGRSWTLAAGSGLPVRPGDQIAVLKRTSRGFIAAGTNAPAGNPAAATPVIFLSADGRHWTRLGAGQLRLGLAAGTGRAAGIRLAAAEGNQILIAGDVVRGHAATARTGGAWLSRDGGRSWRPVNVPGGFGAQPEFSDAATIAGGYLLVRPAMAAGVPAADIYLSRNGVAWRFAATLTGAAGFTPGLINSGPEGVALTGVSGGKLLAFFSHDGVAWWQTASVGDATSQTVSGVAVTNAGAVIGAGVSAAVPGSDQRLITVDGSTGSVRSISLAAIPGGVEPQLAVNALAAQDGTQVAVGSANGFPAAWVSADRGGTWHRATGRTGMVLDNTGIQQLTGVTHGGSGWLAVGGVADGGTNGTAGAAAPHPLVLVSASASTWSAVDGEFAFSGAGLVTRQAASNGDTYVIVGDQMAGSGPGGRAMAAAWWSDGLRGWHRAGDAAAGALEDGANSLMLAVTASGSGFAAAGSHGARPAVWLSRDGRSWRRSDLPLPSGASGAVLQHIVANDRTVVAMGVAQVGAGRVPFVARSADGGMTWHEVALPSPAGATRGTEVTALTAAGSGFAATGTFSVSPGHQDVVIWTSADGMHWTAATPGGRGFAGPGIKAITGLDASGDLLTGVGFTATPTDEEPTLWLARIRLTVPIAVGISDIPDVLHLLRK